MMEPSFEIEPPHRMTFTVENEGYVMYSVQCPHDHLGIDRPCSTWTELSRNEPCRCDCDACQTGNHDDCEQDYVDPVGRKYCQAYPVDMCWYQHMASEVGVEAFCLVEPITFTVPVHLSGGSADDSIDVSVA